VRHADCPVCGLPALEAHRARGRVKPPAWTAWAAKWATLVVVVPLAAMVVVSVIAFVVDEWPPRGALDVLGFVGAGAGVLLGIVLLAAIPLGIWIGLVHLVARLVESVAPRVRNAGLRILLDRQPRRQRRRFTLPWSRVALGTGPRMRLAAGGLLALLFVAEVGFDLAGSRATLDFSSASHFGISLGLLLVMNVVMLFMAAFPGMIALGAIAWGIDYLARPPALWAWPSGTIERNAELIADWQKGRAVAVGCAQPLNEVEREALDRAGRPPPQAHEFEPACLALRVCGTAGGDSLDDARVQSFAVVLDDGRRVVVDARDAVLALDDTGALPPSMLVESVVLGVGLTPRALEVSGARLQVGDRVRVVGEVESLALPGGYRQQRSCDLFVASDAAPVVISAG
jgi:hypothetical protein